MRRILLALAALAAACSRGDSDARARVFSREEPTRPAAAAFDFEHPEAALRMSGDELAQRLGAFEWTGAVEWTVERSGAEATRVQVAEHHSVRQLPGGELEVRAELDPSLGPGSVTGKQVIYVDGMTYARALPAAFRERPTDHGRDARRYRDDSLGLAASVAGLYGSALRLEPAGETTALGRPARRFRITLAPGAAAAPALAPAVARATAAAMAATPARAAAPASGKAPAEDADTARRRAFLDGRVPEALEGELIADAASGAPLQVRIKGAFGVRADPAVRTEVDLLARVTTIGAAVRAVSAPDHALPDERKPAGPSTALEAAGLKKRGEEQPGGKAEAEPADEQE